MSDSVKLVGIEILAQIMMMIIALQSTLTTNIQPNQTSQTTNKVNYHLYPTI